MPGLHKTTQVTIPAGPSFPLRPRRVSLMQVQVKRQDAIASAPPATLRCPLHASWGSRGVLSGPTSPQSSSLFPLAVFLPVLRHEDLKPPQDPRRGLLDSGVEEESEAGESQAGLLPVPPEPRLPEAGIQTQGNRATGLSEICFHNETPST